MNLLRFAHVAKHTNLGLYFGTSVSDCRKMVRKLGPYRRIPALSDDFQGVGGLGKPDASEGRFSNCRCRGGRHATQAVGLSVDRCPFLF